MSHDATPGSSGVAWALLRESGPLILVHYSDDAERDETVSLVRVSAPPGLAVEETDDLDAALAAPGALVILADRNQATSPEKEPLYLTELERRRDALGARMAPIVVFILRGGIASQRLKDLPWLASFVRGKELIPAHLDSVDAGEERRQFIERTKLDPAEWLRRYRAGEWPDTEETNWLAAKALFLEDGHA